MFIKITIMVMNYDITNIPELKCITRLPVQKRLFVFFDKKSFENAKQNSFSKIAEILNIDAISLSKCVSNSEFGTDEVKTLSLTGIEFEHKSVTFFLIDSSSDHKIELSGGSVADAVQKCRQETICIVNCTSVDDKTIYTNFALGFGQKIYRFSHYLTTEKAKADLPKIKSVEFLTENDVDFGKINAKLKAIYTVRDLVNHPANTVYPKSYVDFIQHTFQNTDIKIKVLDQKQMESLGMYSLLGVSKGSSKEPYCVIMEYYGNKDSNIIDYAFIGKGVTFDSGGMSIKPSSGMEDMKGDMAGSATVVGSMMMTNYVKPKKNIIGMIGLVENMINGEAQKPGDIVTSMSGQTIEVLNTDAEGRLVLADVLYYAATKYKPNKMIDFATLTGAMLIALGDVYAGFMSNSDELAEEITQAGEKTGEICWRLPFHEEYNKLMNSDIADMRNTGRVDRLAGSITAGEFLKRFIADTKHYAHIDIAGVSDNNRDKPLFKAGASGWGVKLVCKLLCK